MEIVTDVVAKAQVGNPSKKDSLKFKLSFTKNHYCEREHWISFYPTFDKLGFRFSIGSYFDERLQINSHVTTVIAFLGLCFQPWLSLWFLPVWIIALVVPFGHFFLNLPIYSGIDNSETPEYGFYLYGKGRKLFDSFWWCWGMEKYCFYMPWSYDWVRTSTKLSDGAWFNDTKGNRLQWFSSKGKEYGTYDWLQENKQKEVFDYSYKLNSGEIQNVKATISVEQKEWRQRWLKWTKLFNKVRTSIAIDFSDEVGEGRGSWKGGTVGCSHDLLPNETPEQCLRRMEKERKFSR